MFIFFCLITWKFTDMSKIFKLLFFSIVRWVRLLYFMLQWIVASAHLILISVGYVHELLRKKYFDGHTGRRTERQTEIRTTK